MPLQLVPAAHRFGVRRRRRVQGCNVTIGGETLSVYRHISDESGRWLDQRFCSRCGTNVAYTLEAVPGIWAIAAGTFDDASWIDPTSQQFRHVFVRSARQWSEIPHGAEQYQMHFRR